VRAGAAVASAGLTLGLMGLAVGVFGGGTFGPCMDGPAVASLLLVVLGALVGLVGLLITLGTPRAGREGDEPSARDQR